MKLTQNDLDGLSEQLLSLYKDLPSEFQIIDSNALKTLEGQKSVLAYINQLLQKSEAAVTLTVLKFAILSTIFESIQSLVTHASHPDAVLPSLSEQQIESALKKNYPYIYTALFKTRKSSLDILGEHRNAASKLFCLGSLPRSLSMFGHWITKTRASTILDPTSFTDSEQSVDDDYSSP